MNKVILGLLILILIPNLVWAECCYVPGFGCDDGAQALATCETDGGSLQADSCDTLRQPGMMCEVGCCCTVDGTTKTARFDIARRDCTTNFNGQILAGPTNFDECQAMCDVQTGDTSCSGNGGTIYLATAECTEGGEDITGDVSDVPEGSKCIRGATCTEAEIQPLVIASLDPTSITSTGTPLITVTFNRNLQSVPSISVDNTEMSVNACSDELLNTWCITITVNPGDTDKTLTVTSATDEDGNSLTEPLTETIVINLVVDTTPPVIVSVDPDPITTYSAVQMKFTFDDALVNPGGDSITYQRNGGTTHSFNDCGDEDAKTWCTGHSASHAGTTSITYQISGAQNEAGLTASTLTRTISVGVSCSGDNPPTNAQKGNQGEGDWTYVANPTEPLTACQWTCPNGYHDEPSNSCVSYVCLNENTVRSQTPAADACPNHNDNLQADAETAIVGAGPESCTDAPPCSYFCNLDNWNYVNGNCVFTPTALEEVQCRQSGAIFGAFTGAAEAGQIVLNWQASDDELNGIILEGYRVIKEKDGEEIDRILLGNTLTYVDKEIDAGSYEYKIEAFFDNGMFSNFKEVDNGPIIVNTNTDQSICQINSIPFGMFESETTCHEKPGCYFDATDAIVGECKSCKDVTHCSNFNSKDACEQSDRCHLDSCQWVGLPGLEQLGKGFCVEPEDTSCTLPDGFDIDVRFLDASFCSQIGNCDYSEADNTCVPKAGYTLELVDDKIYSQATENQITVTGGAGDITYCISKSLNGPCGTTTRTIEGVSGTVTLPWPFEENDKAGQYYIKYHSGDASLLQTLPVMVDPQLILDSNALGIGEKGSLTIPPQYPLRIDGQECMTCENLAVGGAAANIISNPNPLETQNTDFTVHLDSITEGTHEFSITCKDLALNQKTISKALDTGEPRNEIVSPPTEDLFYTNDANFKIRGFGEAGGIVLVNHGWEDIAGDANRPLGPQQDSIPGAANPTPEAGCSNFALRRNPNTNIGYWEEDRLTLYVKAPQNCFVQNREIIFSPAEDYQRVRIAPGSTDVADCANTNPADCYSIVRLQDPVPEFVGGDSLISVFSGDSITPSGYFEFERTLQTGRNTFTITTTHPTNGRTVSSEPRQVRYASSTAGMSITLNSPSISSGSINANVEIVVSNIGRQFGAIDPTSNHLVVDGNRLCEYNSGSYGPHCTVTCEEYDGRPDEICTFIYSGGIHDNPTEVKDHLISFNIKDKAGNEKVMTPIVARIDPNAPAEPGYTFSSGRQHDGVHYINTQQVSLTLDYNNPPIEIFDLGGSGSFSHTNPEAEDLFSIDLTNLEESQSSSFTHRSRKKDVTGTAPAGSFSKSFVVDLTDPTLAITRLLFTGPNTVIVEGEASDTNFDRLRFCVDPSISQCNSNVEIHEAGTFESPELTLPAGSSYTVVVTAYDHSGRHHTESKTFSRSGAIVTEVLPETNKQVLGSGSIYTTNSPTVSIRGNFDGTRLSLQRDGFDVVPPVEPATGSNLFEFTNVRLNSDTNTFTLVETTTDTGGTDVLIVGSTIEISKDVVGPTIVLANPTTGSVNVERPFMQITTSEAASICRVSYLSSGATITQDMNPSSTDFRTFDVTLTNTLGISSTVTFTCEDSLGNVGTLPVTIKVDLSNDGIGSFGLFDYTPLNFELRNETNASNIHHILLGMTQTAPTSTAYVNMFVQSNEDAVCQYIEATAGSGSFGTAGVYSNNRVTLNSLVALPRRDEKYEFFITCTDRAGWDSEPVTLDLTVNPDYQYAPIIITMDPPLELNKRKAVDETPILRGTIQSVDGSPITSVTVRITEDPSTGTYQKTYQNVNLVGESFSVVLDPLESKIYEYEVIVDSAGTVYTGRGLMAIFLGGIGGCISVNKITRCTAGDTVTSWWEDSIDDQADNDGLPDSWERAYFGLTLTDEELVDIDPLDDPDDDGLTNLEEYGDQFNQVVTNPRLADTDNDGIGDKEEIDAGSDPLDPRSPS